MEKKIVRIILFVALLFITKFCYAEDNVATPPSDGIYQLSEDVTIKFIIPKGWSINKTSTTAGQVIFWHNRFKINAQLMIGLGKCFDFNLKRMKEVTEKEWKKEKIEILESKIIDFVNVQAWSCTYIFRGSKIKRIDFCRAEQAFLIYFESSNDVFKELIAEVEEGLKTFTIISPAPKRP